MSSLVDNPERVLVLQVKEPEKDWEFLFGFPLVGNTNYSMNDLLNYIAKVPMNCGVSLRLGIDFKYLNMSSMIFDGRMGNG